jgi:hypothetical protein
MTLTINGERVECALSVLTLVLYEQEFDGADLIADISGKVTTSDITPDADVLFDFAKVPWTKVMQAAWAMVKTVDQSTPHFEQWAAKVTQVDSWEFRSVVDSAVNETFFHSAAADSSDGEGRQEVE